MDIEKSLKEGFERLKERTGLVLLGVFFVISLVSTVASQSQAARAMEDLDELPFDFGDLPFDVFEPGPLAFDLPSSLISLMSIGSSVAFIVAAIVAYRVFAADAREKIPEEAYSDNIVIASINGIVAGILFAIIIFIGLILLVIPGIYLFVALAFFLVFIALEDDNFIEALQSSWGLTRGRRLSVFLLFVALLIIGIVVSIVGSIAGALVGSAVPELGAMVNIAFGAAVSVFNFAVLVSAYHQLKEGKSAEGVPG